MHAPEMILYGKPSALMVRIDQPGIIIRPTSIILTEMWVDAHAFINSVFAIFTIHPFNP
jgi:hypothetical protein